jgi:hypothetical protein
VNGGGIFPDLEIAEDTLSLKEQELVRVTAEAQFPLNLRLMEYGFELANLRRESNTEDDVTDAEFEALMSRLVEEGLGADLAADPAIRDYLRWRSRIALWQRMDDVGAEAGVLAQRDRPLSEAIRLLSSNTTQTELFTAVDASSTAARVGSQR